MASSMPMALLICLLVVLIVYAAKLPRLLCTMGAANGPSTVYPLCTSMVLVSSRLLESS
jgi:hypothetical protein